MSKLGSVVLLLLAQILLLQAMAHGSEAPLPGVNPLEDRTQEGVQLHIADHPVSGATESSTSTSTSSSSSSSSSEERGEYSKAAEAPESHIRRLGKHHSTDKSVAGGGVIIGGLVTAIFAAIFCYIRVTRKRDSDCSGK